MILVYDRGMTDESQVQPVQVGDLPDIMTATELAELLGFDYSHICRLCRRGIVSARRFGGRWLITRRDAEAWLSTWKRRQRAAKEAPPD